MSELEAQDEVLASGGDYLDDEERERLHQAIERGLEDVAAGRTIDAKTVIEGLRRAALDASGTEPR
jgi:predicted transcriptional regulator